MDQVTPEPTVGALILNPAGEMLLVRSHKWKGKYTIPGGHVELGEKVSQAVVRESKEETGLDVKDVEFLCWQEFIYDEAFWKPRHFLFLDFACRCEGGQVTLNDEAEEFFWVRPEKALELPIDQYTVVTIREYLKRESRNLPSKESSIA
ncbi:MAG: NUDIX domain-containing protein [Anaerolineales bacterium]|jgi:nucleoside triphosphatase